MSAQNDSKMSARTAETLHITNGDAVIYAFKKAGIVGTHLPWRDALYEGPVPAGLALEELSQVRGQYLATRGFGNPIKILHDLEQRDATVRRAAEFAEVVLWFEHDLYDQLHLLQLLPVLAEMRLAPGHITIVQSGEYLGAMTADEISALYPKRRPVSAAMYATAKRAWDAFTSADPRALGEEIHDEDLGLPFLRAAMRRLCEEYPWTRDRMSRSHRQTLQAVAHGPARNIDLFHREQALEEAAFLGDTAFYAILEDLRREPALVEGVEGNFVPTALGRLVLAADSDWLEVADTIDRWIGGVHLSGSQAVRWDDASATFRFAEQAVDS